MKEPLLSDAERAFFQNEHILNLEAVADHAIAVIEGAPTADNLAVLKERLLWALYKSKASQCLRKEDAKG